jgi:hypothetical protein
MIRRFVKQIQKLTRRFDKITWPTSNHEETTKQQTAAEDSKVYRADSEVHKKIREDFAVEFEARRTEAEAMSSEEKSSAADPTTPAWA